LPVGNDKKFIYLAVIILNPAPVSKMTSTLVRLVTPSLKGFDSSTIENWGKRNSLGFVQLTILLSTIITTISTANNQEALELWNNCLCPKVPNHPIFEDYRVVNPETVVEL